MLWILSSSSAGPVWYEFILVWNEFYESIFSLIFSHGDVEVDHDDDDDHYCNDAYDDKDDTTDDTNDND